MSDILLEARNVTKHFPAKKNLFGRPLSYVRAVSDVSFTLKKGETLGIVGESGCGKSTLGRVMLRLIDSTSGEIDFRGQDITQLKGESLRSLRRDMQLVFQDPFASLNPRMTVGEILAEPLLLHGTVPPNKRKERVAELLSLVGLRPEAHLRYPHEFSGGQRQRVGIARALAANPELIVADEAVSALDVSVQAQVLNLLKDLQAKLGLTVVFIAHDLAVVRHIATRVAVMYLGRIVELSPTEELFANPRHPYTRALLSAIPVPNPDAARQRVILTGDVPSPINPPPGCAFHTRCPSMVEACKAVVPPLEGKAQAAAGHEVACIRADELPPIAILPPEVQGPGAERLKRLQTRFAAGRPAA